MLTDSNIKQAINNKKIEILISLRVDTEGKCQLLTPLQPIQQSLLKDNLYSDRLKLTMGPVVKMLNNKRVKKKNRFKGYKDCYDMRTSDNKILINPGESIIILTNERIKLNGEYACLIVPRISLTDVGIVVSTAYVDPFYDGLLRLHLTNMSNKAYELKTLESIAQCFFFELSSNASSKYKDEFSAKSVFYGQTWKGILEEDRHPFPTKKVNAQMGKGEQVKNQVKKIGKIFKEYSLIGSAATILITAVVGYYGINYRLVEYYSKVEKLAQWMESTDSEIVIPAGQLRGEKKIKIKVPKENVITVMVNNEDVHYKIFSGTTINEAEIVFSYSLSNISEQTTQIDFSYVVIGR